MSFLDDFYGNNPPPADPNAKKDPFLSDFYGDPTQTTPDLWNKQADTQPQTPNFDKPGFGSFLPGLNYWWNNAVNNVWAKNYYKLPDGTYQQSDPNVLQLGSRAIGEGFKGVLGGFNYATDKFQEALSLPQTALDVAGQAGWLPENFPTEYWLPDMKKKDEALRNLKNVDPLSVVGMAYNSARIITGSRKLAWEDIKNIAEANASYYSKAYGTDLAQKAFRMIENTQFAKNMKAASAKSMTENNGEDKTAGRNLFSDANLRAEYVRRYMSGEDSRNLVDSLTNPFAEMAFDMVADPTNLVGGVIDDAFKAARAAKAEKGFATVAEVADGWKALETMAAGADEVAPVIDDMAGKLLTRNTEAANKLLDVTDVRNPFRFTQAAKADQLADSANTVFNRILIDLKHSPADLQDALRALALIGSRKIDDIKEGLRIWRSVNPGLGALVTSEEGMKAAQFLNRVMSDETGVMTGRMIGDIVDAAKAGKLPEVLDKWNSLANRVMKEMYPSIIDMAKQPEKYKVPAWAVNVAKAHDAAQAGVIGKTNKFFANIYLSLSPGYSTRNLLNNIFTAAVDFSPEVAAQSVGTYAEKIAGREPGLLGKIVEMLGYEPDFVQRAGKASDELGKSSGLFGWYKSKITSLNEKSEQAASIAIVYNSLKRTLGKAMKEGVGLADAGELRALGVKEDQIRRLFALVEQNNGNVDKALAAWLGEHSSGVLDTFRDVRAVLNPNDIHAAKNTPGLMEAIDRVLHAPDRQTAIKYIQEIRDQWLKKAARDVEGMIPSIDDGDVIGQDIRAAINAGLNERAGNLFNIKLRVQRQVTDAMIEAGNKILDAITNVNGVDEATRRIITSVREQTRSSLAEIVASARQQHDLLLAQVRKVANGNVKMIESSAQGIEGYKAWRLAHADLEPKDALWTFYFEQRKLLHDGELTKTIQVWQNALGANGPISGIAGRDLMQEDAMKLAFQNAEDATKIMNAEVINENGIWVDGVKLALNMGNEVGAIRGLGNRVLVRNDAHLINVINKYLPEGATPITRLREISFKDAQDALNKYAQETIASDIAAAADPSVPLSIKPIAGSAKGMKSTKGSGGTLLGWLRTYGLPLSEKPNISNADRAVGLFRKNKAGDLAEIASELVNEGFLPASVLNDVDGGVQAVRDIVQQALVGGVYRIGEGPIKGMDKIADLPSVFDMLKSGADPADIQKAVTAWNDVMQTNYTVEQMALSQEIQRIFLTADSAKAGDVANYYNRIKHLLDNLQDHPLPDQIVTDLLDSLNKVTDQAEKIMKNHVDPNTPVEDIIKKMEEVFLRKEGTQGMERVGVKVMDGSLPAAQAARENLRGVQSLLNRLEAGVSATWGRGRAVADLTAEQMAAVNTWKRTTVARMTKVRAVAEKIAQQERNFALLDYGQKTSLDHALAYIMPYQFWYSRSYRNWMSRLAQHPEVLSRYASYKKWLQAQHKDLPDWWKSNVSFNDLPGMNVENPMYMNLEATLNPLNGLMGIDFEDKNKLVGAPGTFEYYLTRILDGAGKFGPSVWTPISMATAAYLSMKGYDDAAARWSGRLLPQSTPLKALASKFGINADLDPMVWLTSGRGLKGFDAYEARRIGRAMASMVDEKSTMPDGTVITPEIALEAMHNQSGPVFEQAQLRATQDRATGSFTGFLFGVGFKQRSSSDMSIDKFYEDYNALWQQQNDLTPQEFKVANDKLREMYPFMDSVLLAKKGGWERDRAYAYNVMGRIAPGDVGSILKAAGLQANIIDKFYAEKGAINKWQPTDYEKFMAAMVDIGTTLQIPEYATQQQWTQAKNAYKTLNDLAASQLGADIWDKVDLYRELKDQNEKDAFLKAHPEVTQAMDFKAYAVANDPILAKYYDGLGNIESYYKGAFRHEIDQVLPGWYDMLKARDAVFDKNELKAFDKQNNYYALLKEYNKIKKAWDTRIDRIIYDYGKNLPDVPQSIIRTDINPAATSTGQQGIIDAVQPAAQVDWNQVSGVVPEALKLAMDQYYNDSRPMTTAEKSMLSRVAKYLSMTTDELMQAYFASQP